ncbi:MAG: large subunit ribosomal protein L15 [Parcubacteria group bacterium Gr01-1014_3]|nr:MAG: large subunit ribosomal protein L15 [Parcubacteria group bacterium Gr01-1014_3]
MQLHTLKRNNPLKEAAPRVARGGKRGHTSGRGQKGQRSRSGHRIRPAIRELIRRLPKLRGHKNKPKSDKLDVLNVNDLEKRAVDGIISQEILGAKFKILGGGEIKKAVTVKGLPVSESAKKKIIAAGGKVE